MSRADYSKLPARYPVLWYYRDQFLGEGKASDQSYAGTLAPPPSLAYGCQRCGDIWARIVVDAPSQWRFIPRLCNRCGGGAMLPFEPAYSRELPPAVGMHELLSAPAQEPSQYEIFLTTGGA